MSKRQESTWPAAGARVFDQSRAEPCGSASIRRTRGPPPGERDGDMDRGGAPPPGWG